MGIDNECRGIRSLSWKLLVGYLPEKRDEWEQKLNLAREDYEYYISHSFSSSKREYNE